MNIKATSFLQDFIMSQRQNIVDFACRLIAAPSENPPGDERLVADLIVGEAASLGLPSPKVISYDSRRPNVIFELKFNGNGPRLLYNGHLDTKPIGDRSKWNTDPLKPIIKDGVLYGLGACDMKGSVAALLYAAAAMAKVSECLTGSLLLVFSADEEAGGKYGAEFLAEKGLIRADVGLIAESVGITEEWESIPIISRGETCFKIKIYGTQMHSSISDIVPSINANVKMAEIILRMQKELRFSYEPTPLCPQGVTIGLAVMARGGVFYGVLPGYAEFSTDVRILPGMTREQIERDLSSFIKRLKSEDPSLEIAYEFEPLPLGWIEPVIVAQNHPFVKVVSAASKRILGKTVPLGSFPAWTDARFFQHVADVPTIPAFGPGFITQAHSPNESVRVDSLFKACHIYALSGVEYLSK